MLKTKPKISVIVPLYNKETSIKKTILSVLTQTLENFELIVVNDGSTDDSLQVLSSIKDERIKILSKKNGGVSAARNYGIKNSNSEWIFFLDADDLIQGNCLEVLLDTSNKYPKAEIITSNFQMITDNRKFDFCKRTVEGYVDNPFKEFWKRNVFLRTGNILIKRECFDSIDVWFDPLISKYEDLDFMIRLINKFKVAYTPQSLFIYDTSYSELSVFNSQLENEFGYYARLDKSFSYRNLLLSENVAHLMISHLRKRNYKSFFLLKKNICRLHIILYSILYRKLTKF